MADNTESEEMTVSDAAGHVDRYPQRCGARSFLNGFRRLGPILEQVAQTASGQSCTSLLAGRA
jgi:hypothetical protein